MSVSQDPERVQRATPVEHPRERRVCAEERAGGEVHGARLGRGQVRAAVIDKGDVGADGRPAEAYAIGVDGVVGLEFVAVWGLNMKTNE